MKNPFIIPAAMICAAILAGFWMLKPPSEPQKVIVIQPSDISFFQAAREGNIETVKQHIAAGTDVNAAGGYAERTPLHEAAYNGHKEIAELLISNGADVNAKDKDSWIPMHMAAIYSGGHKQIIELMIAEGVDVNAKGRGGATALQGAASRGHIKIVEFLIGKGANVNTKATRRGYTLTALDTVLNRKDRLEMADLLRKHGAKTWEELKAEEK